MAAPLALGLWLVTFEHARASLPGWYQRGLLGILGALAALTTIGGLVLFEQQRHYYQVLTPDLVAGLRWVRDSTPPDTVIAVNRADANILGWWAEALTERDTYYASQLRYLSFADERARARVANELFADGYPSREALDAARDEGIDVVVMATTTWLAQLRYGETPPDARVLFANDGVMIVSTRP